MLASLLGAAGITSGDMAAGRERLEQVACAIEDQARMLAQEYGQPVRDGSMPAHTPARVPYIALQELAASASTSLNLETLLGKPCTRGHLANIGDEEVKVRFRGLRDETLSGWYTIPGSAVLDISSWATRYLEIEASAATAAEVEAGSTTTRRLQVLAQ